MVADLQELARRMLAGYDARTPGQLFAVPLDLTTALAYALQTEIARLREERGERVIGYKVGCTSRAIQVQLGVKEPIFGRLFDTECHPSGVHLSTANYNNLAVEGEFAVRLSKDLPVGPLTANECREAIAEVSQVIELHPCIGELIRWLFQQLHRKLVKSTRRTVNFTFKQMSSVVPQLGRTTRADFHHAAGQIAVAVGPTLPARRLLCRRQTTSDGPKGLLRANLLRSHRPTRANRVHDALV